MASASACYFLQLALIDGRQLIAARGLLGLEQKTLAEKAGVSLSTIQRMEDCVGPIKARTTVLWRVAAALEALGIELLDKDGAIGAVLKPPAGPAKKRSRSTQSK